MDECTSRGSGRSRTGRKHGKHGLAAGQWRERAAKEEEEEEEAEEAEEEG